MKSKNSVRIPVILLSITIAMVIASAPRAGNSVDSANEPRLWGTSVVYEAFHDDLIVWPTDDLEDMMWEHGEDVLASEDEGATSYDDHTVEVSWSKGFGYEIYDPSWSSQGVTGAMRADFWSYGESTILWIDTFSTEGLLGGANVASLKIMIATDGEYWNPGFFVHEAGHLAEGDASKDDHMDQNQYSDFIMRKAVTDLSQLLKLTQDQATNWNWEAPFGPIVRPERPVDFARQENH